MAGKPVLISIGSEFDSKGIAEAKRQLAALEKNLPTGKLAEMGMKFQQVGAKMQAVGKSLTKNVTLPIVAIGAAATAAFIEFDNSMTKITSLVGIATDEVDGMRSSVISMATATGKSAAEAADALFFITSAGLRGSDAMDVLDMSLKASAIGLGETKVIADLATSAMNAYGSSTLNATQATDVLTAAVREGKLEPAELAQAMGQVLPIASNLGVSFNEVGAAFAGMSRTGTNASQAATQLRGILNSLLKPSKQAETQLAAMGLSSEGLREQLREKGLLSVLTTLKDSFGDNDAAAAKVFGNIRALSGVLDLMGSNVEDNIGIFNRMNDVSGITNEGFETVSQTAGFKLKEAFNSLKNSLIEFGAIIAPVVADVAKFFTGMAEAFNSLSPATKETIVRLAAVAAAIGPVLLIGGKLVSLIGSMILLLPKLGIAFTLATGPIGLIIAAVAALIAGIVLLYKNNEDFRNFVQTVWKMIGEFISTVVGMIRKVLDDNRETIEKVREAFAKLGQFIMTHIAPILQKLFGYYLKFLIEVFKQVIKAVTLVIKIFVEMISVIIKVIAAVVNIAASIVSGLVTGFKAVQDFGLKFNSFFKDLISKMFNIGKDIVMGIWNGLKSMVTWMQTNVTAWVKSVLPDPIERFLGISSPSKLFAKIGVNVAEGLIQGLDEKKDGVTAKAKELLTNALNMVKEGVEQARQFGQSIADSLFKNVDISAAATTAKETGISIVDAIVKQSQRAIEFGNTMRRLLAVGLNKQTYTEILQLGTERGMEVASAYLNGNTSEMVRRTNEAVTAAKNVADAVGRDAALTFEKTGIQNAVDLLTGLIKELMPSGRKRRELMAIMDNLAKSLNRRSTIVIETIHVGGGGGGGGGAPAPSISTPAPPNRVIVGPGISVPTPPRLVYDPVSGVFRTALAKGGIVTRPTNALIGEAGPEAVIPLNRAGGMMGGNIYNITVNPGLSTNVETGRSVVEAIKHYERISGKQFANA